MAAAAPFVSPHLANPVATQIRPRPRGIRPTNGTRFADS